MGYTLPTTRARTMLISGSVISRDVDSLLGTDSRLVCIKSSFNHPLRIASSNFEDVYS